MWKHGSMVDVDCWSTNPHFFSARTILCRPQEQRCIGAMLQPWFQPSERVVFECVPPHSFSVFLEVAWENHEKQPCNKQPRSIAKTHFRRKPHHITQYTTIIIIMWFFAHLPSRKDQKKIQWISSLGRSGLTRSPKALPRSSWNLRPRSIPSWPLVLSWGGRSAWARDRRHDGLVTNLWWRKTNAFHGIWCGFNWDIYYSYCVIYIYIILYYIILYYIILYVYIILYYMFILCYIILYYVILYYIMLYYIILYYIICLYYIILYYVILYYIMFYYIILCYIILYYIMFYYIILYYTMFYSVILY